MSDSRPGRSARLAFNGYEEDVQVVNLTDHDVALWGDGEIVSLPPSGKVARCCYRRVTVGQLQVGACRIPVTQNVVDKVIDLPKSRPGTYFVVSLMVASVARDRGDLLIPDSPMKDQHGATVAARSLGITAGADLPEYHWRDDVPLPPNEPPEDALAEIVGTEEIDSATLRPTVPPPRVSARPSMPFPTWYRQVAEAVEERTGRPAARLSVDWQDLYAEGLAPESAVDQVLGGDLLGDMLSYEA